jgi:hypothetical protein
VTIILASHDLTMSADLVPGLLVRGTEEMIESIAENLIDNAVSFAPSGSEILVHLTRENSFAHMTVSDQGPGCRLDSSSGSSTVITPSGTLARRMNPPRLISGSGYRSHAAMSTPWAGPSRRKTERPTDWRCICVCRWHRAVTKGLIVADGRCGVLRSGPYRAVESTMGQKARPTASSRGLALANPAQPLLPIGRPVFERS